MSMPSKKLLYLRVRDRVMRVLEVHADVDCAAKLGAFDMLELIYYLLPIDDREAEWAFNSEEVSALQKFLEHADAASEATSIETWGRQQFLASPEWSALRHCSEAALAVFNKRGRFEEEVPHDATSTPMSALAWFGITLQRTSAG